MAGAVYNEVTDAWMIPQADPFTLENFQQAYDNLAARKSTLVQTKTLTTAQAAEFTVGKRLKPTHYALKIYPRNEDEQWKVEAMEDVKVAYMPFDWVQLTPEEVEKVAHTKSTANTFAEKSPYTVTPRASDCCRNLSTPHPMCRLARREAPARRFGVCYGLRDIPTTLGCRQNQSIGLAVERRSYFGFDKRSYGR